MYIQVKVNYVTFVLNVALYTNSNNSYHAKSVAPAANMLCFRVGHVLSTYFTA